MSKTTCPNCGRDSATIRKPKAYRYDESGLPNLWLHGGVTEIMCSACGETTVSIAKEGQLLQVIAAGLLMAPRGLSGAELRFVRAACHMSQAMLAEALHITRRETIAERERKEKPLPFPEELGVRIVLLRAFLEHLEADGNCHLTTSSRRELERFAHELLAFSRLATNKLSKLKLDATLEADLWSLKKAA